MHVSGSFMSNVFQVGQLVEPRSGGPKMTIVSVAEDKIQEAYYCTWFRGAEQQFGEFLGEALTVIKGDQEPSKPLTFS